MAAFHGFDTWSKNMVRAEALYVGNYSVNTKSRLAEGGFGFVDLVEDATTHTEYVLKRCALQTRDSFQIVQLEIKMLQQFKGDYVVKLLASDTSGRNGGMPEALLLLEHCPGGHLLDRLKTRSSSHRPLSQDEVARYFGMLLQAVIPMHEASPPVIHRDLKLENILFGSDNKLRLIDFGSCHEGYMYMRNPEERASAEENIGKFTTQMYRAPEMVDLYLREVLTEKTDIWALGCIFYALIFLRHPFQDAGNLGILSAKIDLTLPTNVSEDAKSLVGRMLDADPEARPSARQLLECAKALLTGAPLPVIEVPEEARIRRQQRIENETRRAQIIAARKKAEKQTVQRPQGPLDTSSVAARRLAAKRGQAVDGGPSPVSMGDLQGSKSPSSSNDMFFGGDSGFGSAGAGDDDFFGAPAVSSTAEDLFFSSGSGSAQNDFGSQGVSAPVSTDFFGSGSHGNFSEASSTPTPTPSNADFDPFSSSSSAAAFLEMKSVQSLSSHSDGFNSAGSNNFDPFDSSSVSPAPSNAVFDAFGAPASSVQSVEAFDPFASSSPAPALVPTPLKQPSRDANDFDFLGGGGSSGPSVTEKSMISDFESFGVQPKAKKVDSVLSLFDAPPAKSISTIAPGPMGNSAPRPVMMANPVYGMPGGGGMSMGGMPGGGMGGMYPMGGMGSMGGGAPIMTTRPSMPQGLPSPSSQAKKAGGSDPFGSLNVFGK